MITKNESSPTLQEFIEPLPHKEWLSSQPHCDASLSYWDAAKCKEFSQIALRHWRVKVLADALTAMHSPVMLYCLKCDKDADHIAGYSPTYNSVWICANRFSSSWKFRQALIHELVHAFDFARAHIDPSDVRHVACSEIRAYNLSEQCGLRATWNENSDGYESGPLRDAIIREELKRCQIQSESNKKDVTISEVSVPNTPSSSLSSSSSASSIFESVGISIKSYVDRIRNNCAKMGKKIGSRDEVDEWKLQDTKRKRCLSHKTLQSLRDHEIAKLNPKLAYESITDVIQRCTRDTWPFMGPPERDSRWRPSRLYVNGTAPSSQQ